MNPVQANELFVSVFGGCAEVCGYAPGRVNLIGEHTDYNGGHVLPCALRVGTYALARKRRDGVMRFVSANDDTAVEIAADKEIRYTTEYGWANYVVGMAYQFIKRGRELSGFDCLVAGDVPRSAGLSSSASLELAVAVALNGLFEWGIHIPDLVLMAQACENGFVGLECGIMDQFAVGMGKAGHGILLDCQTLDYNYIPLHLKGFSLIIANTHKSRSLANSIYNERRGECRRALNDLRTLSEGLPCLCALTPEQFKKTRRAITDAVAAKRVEHAVYENARVLEAASCLKAGDIEHFGRLMNASHASLRDLFEVTGFELDTLAETSWGLEGTIGARVTGAGFGGCTVNIVREQAVDRFISVVGQRYKAKTGLTAEFYLGDIGDGAGLRDLPDNVAP